MTEQGQKYLAITVLWDMCRAKGGRDTEDRLPDQASRVGQEEAVSRLRAPGLV